MRPHFLCFLALIAMGSSSAGSISVAFASTAQLTSVGDWIGVPATGNPPAPRREHCAIYDVTRDRMIVYGGTPADVKETWAFDWNPSPHWTQLHPTVTPNAWGGMGAIYDPVRDRMLIFGGWVNGGPNVNEVWALPLDNPTAWVQITTVGTPPNPRSFPVVVYDPSEDRMIVFSGTPDSNDAWALSLSGTPTWTNITPPGGLAPSRRWGSAGVYDPGLDRLVISDGYLLSAPDAWALSLDASPAWQQLAIPPSSSLGLVGATAVLDPSGPTMLIYGGGARHPDGTFPNNADTWALSLTATGSWNVMPHPLGLPPPRRFHSAVYRSVTSQMIVFGGFDDVGQVFRNDVWALQIGPAAPVVNGFAPKGGSVGDTVKISGLFLSQVTSVQFNGVSAPFSVVNDVTLSAIVPGGATTGPITLTSPGGSGSSQDAFFVGLRPVVLGVSADSARISTAVDISGQYFTGATRVSFGGTGSAPFTIVSDTQLTAVIDSAATTGPITVTNPAGSGTSTFSFVVIGPNPRPRLLPVRDVPRDEGGRVVLRWEASDYDSPANHSVVAYRVWRRAPLFALHYAIAQSARATSPNLDVPPELAASATEFWESLAEIPSALLAGYAYTAPTLSDSAGDANPYTAFAVQALTSDATVFYFSNVDSGYSVDNLAPAPPASFAAIATSNGVALHWLASRENDLAGYRLYRGPNATFEPSPTTLIASRTDTGYVDTGGPKSVYYKIVAVDVHGNLSLPAAATPDQPVGVLLSLTRADVVAGKVRLQWDAPGRPRAEWTVQRSETGSWQDRSTVVSDERGIVSFEDAEVQPGARYDYRLRGTLDGQEFLSDATTLTIPGVALAIEAVSPNPFSGSNLVIAFTLSRSAPARLELIDVSGRLVQSSDCGAFEAGRHEIRLSVAPMRSGIHFIRLRQGGQSVERRLAVIR